MFRSRLRFSNLPQEVAALFDESAVQEGMVDAAFLDWACPTCDLPARVYVKFWAGGHADGGTLLPLVLELEPEKRA